MLSQRCHAAMRCRIMALLTRGFPTACLMSTKQLLVHQKALKALHTLFDMEVGAGDNAGPMTCARKHHSETHSGNFARWDGCSFA